MNRHVLTLDINTLKHSLVKHTSRKHEHNRCKIMHINVHKSFLCRPGASYSKLTMSLVNDSLKFQMAILQIHCHLKKCENPQCIANDSHIFLTKNNNVFAS